MYIQTQNILLQSSFCHNGSLTTGYQVSSFSIITTVVKLQEQMSQPLFVLRPRPIYKQRENINIRAASNNIYVMSPIGIEWREIHADFELCFPCCIVFGPVWKGTNFVHNIDNGVMENLYILNTL